MKTLFNFILIILLFILPACDIFDAGDKSNHFKPIEGKIIFTVTYDSTEIIPGHSGFILLMKTEKIYGCCNYGIISTYSMEQNNMTISLHGITTPNICATALGPASSMVPLELADGEYKLHFMHGSKKDEYGLYVDEFSVVVAKIDTGFTIYKPYDSY